MRKFSGQYHYVSRRYSTNQRKKIEQLLDKFPHSRPMRDLLFFLLLFERACRDAGQQRPIF